MSWGGSEKCKPRWHFSSKSATDVDASFAFVVETPDGLVAIEVKSGARWDDRFLSGIRALRQRAPEGKVRALGVYSGARALVTEDVRVLPWQDFLGELWAGRLIG